MKHTENKTIESEIKLFTKKCLKDIRITRSGLTSKQTEIVLGFFYQFLRESLERALKERTESLKNDLLKYLTEGRIDMLSISIDQIFSKYLKQGEKE